VWIDARSRPALLGGTRLPFVRVLAGNRHTGDRDFSFALVAPRSRVRWPRGGQTARSFRMPPARHNLPMAETAYRPVPLVFERLTAAEQRARLADFYGRIVKRRTVRHYSDEPVPEELIDQAIAIAGSAPSGANMQPWTFVVVRDADIKRRIRAAAEEEERRFYAERATAEWLAALKPLGTDATKEFLEVAPCLIVVFKVDYSLVRDPDGAERRLKHYYAAESAGIACGFLLAALHIAGLATLTHTPSPMGFLSSILDRPRNEKPFLLIPVGYPAADAVVPDIAKKSLDEIRINA
jgi:iodotyrosine deiodinase